MRKFEGTCENLKKFERIWEKFGDSEKYERFGKNLKESERI